MHDIKKTLQIWCEDEKVYELRVPKTKRRGVISGYFDDLNALAVNADVLSEDVDIPAVYITLNPVIPDLIARSANEILDRSEVTTKDHEILQRRLLLVDCDPIRPAGISSSASEHEAAIELSRTIREYLSSEGFPASLLADSGNGSHNVYRIDLPNDPESADLVKRFLESLSNRFGNAVVAVDTSVWNASRICKLYGTMTRKGSNHPTRPWRRSQILDFPETLEVVPVELLQKIAGVATAINFPTTIITPKTARETTRGKYTVADVEHLMTEKGLNFGLATPYEGGVRWVLEECPWHGNHSDGPGGSAIFLRNGMIGFDCKHAHCQHRTIKDVLGMVNGDGFKDGTQKVTIAQRLVEMATNAAEIWRSRAGDVWATVEVNGHKENHPIRSASFRRWLTGRYWESQGDAPNEKAIKGAVEVIEHIGSGKVAEHNVYLRYARLSDRLFVDLGGPSWEAVEVTADGWRVIANPPVKFRRTKNTGAMPMPVQGGSVDLLRRVVSVSDDGWVLVLGFLLDAMKGAGPFLLMIAHGEQGSAKSTLCRLVRRLVDPLKEVELSALPKDEQNLAVDGTSEYLLAYDNVSYLAPWLADAFCRVATGGGIKVRTLYTNDEQTALGLVAPVVLNGIPDFAETNDLLGRSLIVRLPRIPDDKRRDEADVHREFQEIRPLVFGGLLDLLSAGLKNLSSVKFEKLPRMADSMKWVTACLGNNTFAAEYAKNIEEAADIGFDASPVAEPVRRLVESDGGSWSGTLAELLNELLLDDPDLKRRKDFPGTARALAGRLKRDAPALRAVGIEYTPPMKTNGKRTAYLTTVNIEPLSGSDAGTIRVGRDDCGRLENSQSSLHKPHKNRGLTSVRDDRDDCFSSLENEGKREEGVSTGESDSRSKESIVPIVPTDPDMAKTPAKTGFLPGTIGRDDCLSTIPIVPDGESRPIAMNLRLNYRNSISPDKGLESLSLSGQSRHLDCFVQLFEDKNDDVENIENARTAWTQPPANDFGNDIGVRTSFTSDNAPAKVSGRTADNFSAPPFNESQGNIRSDRESHRIALNLRLNYRNGYVVQPDPKNLDLWMVGKEVGGRTRWLEQSGTREWAVEEVKRRLEPRPTPPPVPNEGDDDDDHTADVLNTLIYDIDDGRYDLSYPDDLEIVKDQISSEIPEIAEMSDALWLDLDDGHLTLDDVRTRADEMLGVLMQTEEDNWKRLDENMVGTG